MLSLYKHSKDHFLIATLGATPFGYHGDLKAVHIWLNEAIRTTRIPALCGTINIFPVLTTSPLAKGADCLLSVSTSLASDSFSSAVVPLES